MVNCSEFGCTNRSSNHPELSFHIVPSEKRSKSIRKQWLHNIRRDGDLPKDITEQFFICSAHFEEQCFKHDL